MLGEDTRESLQHLIELALLLDPYRILVVPKVKLVIQDHQPDIVVKQVRLHGHRKVDVCDCE